MSRIQIIIKKYPEDVELPIEYNSSPIDRLIEILPKYEKKIKKYDEWLRKNRIWGNTFINNENEIPVISFTTKSGLITLAYAKTIFYDPDGNIEGFSDRSTLNDSEILRREKV